MNEVSPLHCSVASIGFKSCALNVVYRCILCVVEVNMNLEENRFCKFASMQIPVHSNSLLINSPNAGICEMTSNDVKRP